MSLLKIDDDKCDMIGYWSGHAQSQFRTDSVISLLDAEGDGRVLGTLL